MSEAPGPPTKRSRAPAIAAVAAVGIALLLKSKTILMALKGLSAGKLLLTFGSMLAMVAIEARIFGWLFAVGFVLMILVHELGHGHAIKREGLQAGYPIFIPFFGAMIALRGQPRNSLVEARIAIAGPVAGTVAALGATTLFLLTDSRLYLALAYFGYFLNLFNLIPISPLDGGRVARMFSRRIWIVGLAIMAIFFLLHPSPQLAIIGIFALIYSLSRRSAPPGPDETQVTPKERTRMAINYFGLAAFLTIGMLLAGQLLGKR
ncbi:MAG: site-2 protease family protein [Deltaproteobacteria bacterium]|jgi:Zn-dependent protease|nr:site-2 protease family protein [Deltaproteobacteria bacterium]